MTPGLPPTHCKQGAYGRPVAIWLVGSGLAEECLLSPFSPCGRRAGDEERYAFVGSLVIIANRALKMPSSSRVSICQPSFSQMRWMMVRPQP